MSSNSRITRSKGPADGVSLPPITRPKKGTNTEAETGKSMTTQHQADGQGDQLGNTVRQASLFAGPGLRAGFSTAPTIQLKSQILRQLINSWTCNLVGTTGHQ